MSQTQWRGFEASVLFLWTIVAVNLKKQSESYGIVIMRMIRDYELDTSVSCYGVTTSRI